ncbi:MAG TPA: T9SS type A sorting domain-containing protein, partial [Bacteroidia bacterium]
PNSATPFVPALSQWGFQLVSLAPYQSSANAIIKFRNISGYGDQLYLDNINIMNANSVNDAGISSFVNIFPNPSPGTLFINMHFISKEQVAIHVYDVLGQNVVSIEKNDVLGESFKLDLSKENDGIYFIEVDTTGGRLVRKVVVSR